MKWLFPCCMYLLSSCSLAFSQQTVGLFFNDSLALNGYTLWPAPNTTTYLIDNCGFLVNSWDSEFPPGLSAYLSEEGYLWRAGKIPGVFDGNGLGGRIEKFDWDGNLTWAYEFSSETFKQHHDIEPMPNGNVLVIAWEIKTAAEAAQMGAINPVDYWPLYIAELKPIGSEDVEIVWEWHLWDHLIQDTNPGLPNFGVIAEHPELMNINFTAPQQGAPDWVHANSIDYNAERDEILVSIRNAHEVFIIDHSTSTEEAAGHTGGNRGKGGDFLYRWGNPQSYQRGTPADQQLFGQHDAEWIPEAYPGGGQISIFNNGANRPDGIFSSVEVIAPPLDSAGNYMIVDTAAFGPAIPSWQYMSDPPEDFHSSKMSGAQRLSNGNTLICEAAEGLFYEIDLEGNRLWEYINPVGFTGAVAQGSNVPGNSSVFKCIRYSTDYAAFEGRDLTPGDPVELDPFTSECVIYDSVIVANIQESFNLDVQISPNPFSTFLEVSNPENRWLTLIFRSVNGRIIHREQSSATSIQTVANNWLPGLYLLEIRDLELEKKEVLKVLKVE